MRRRIDQPFALQNFLSYVEMDFDSAFTDV